MTKSRKCYISHADLTGMKFGKWTVLYEVDRKDHETGSRWLCKCECGKEQDISGWRLKAGKSIACRSCFFKEHPRKNKLINETGNKYGFLTVLHKSDRKAGLHVCWVCQCKCGSIIDVDITSLRRGKTRSCGCLGTSYGEFRIKQLLDDNNIKFKKEKTFKDLRCENGKYYRFDFYIPDKNYIIEFDGPQHFKAVGWGSKSQIKAAFERTVKNDRIKNDYCAQHNIPLIRIPYTHANDIVLDDLLIEKSKYIYRNGGAKCSS